MKSKYLDLVLQRECELETMSRELGAEAELVLGAEAELLLANGALRGGDKLNGEADTEIVSAKQ